jgi:hypothetical protein
VSTLPARIPVRVVSGPVAEAPGLAVVVLPAPAHVHTQGEACPACAAQADVRALLHDLLVRAERGEIAPFSVVAVAAGDVAGTRDRLVPGRVPATALRDHVVARRFYLADS